MPDQKLTGKIDLKNRFPNLDKALAKRSVLVCVILPIASGCSIHLDTAGPAQVPVSASNTIHTVTPEDIEVYKAFLKQLDRSPSQRNGTSNFTVNLVGDKKDHLNLVNTTADARYIGPIERFTILNNTVKGYGPRDDKFNDLRKSLIERNTKSVGIPKFTSVLPMTFVQSHPLGYMFPPCTIHFSLPVYTKDHTLAMVYFFSEGDNLEDPGAIYVMRKHSTAWFVDDFEWTASSTIVRCG